MTKVSATGPKKYLKDVIDTLHNLEILDIEDYQGELETGRPLEEAEDLSELLVDIRSLLSKMKDVETDEDTNFDLERIQDRYQELSDSIEDLSARKQSLNRDIDDFKSKKRFFKKIKGSGVSYSDLQGSENLDIFVGRLDAEEFMIEVGDQYEIFEGDSAHVVAYRKGSKAEEAVRNHQTRSLEVPEGDFSGSPENIIRDIEDSTEDYKQEIEETEEELEELALEWKGRLESARDFLEEKVEKAEAPLNFATTENAFIVEGWIPEESYDIFEEQLAEASEGNIHVQKEEGDNPPVKHENNQVVQPFESLTDLVSMPRYNELDPSFMLFLTFPIMFGFMIGDAGYGLTSFLVFYGGMKAFPAASDMFKSLMWASVFTFLFGLAFGDAFGFVIFGENSVLAEQFGLGIFSQIPMLFHRAAHLDQVFQIAALIGVAHINVGYLLGAYNEYINHGVKEAFLEKGSWLILEAGALLAYLYGFSVGGPVLAVALVMLLVGEGVEGIVEIPSLVSNILSYLRIFGVSVAAVSLAQVVNSMANPLFQSGSILGIGLGIFLLIFGHTFNTFIKIMEGFLQGIRLHYVEMFTKFYKGGGRKYAPFGAREP